MEMADPEVHSILVAEREEFSTLASEHSELETRLDELIAKHLPSEQERIEETRIKKRKLQLKDHMAAMIRDYRSEKLPVAH